MLNFKIDIAQLKLINFFKKEYQGPKATLVFMSIMGTISMTLLVAIINESAAIMATQDQINMRLFCLYFMTCAMTLICKHYTLTRATTIVEQIVTNIRVRLTDKLRKTDLQFIESTKKGELYARIVHDTDYISQTSTDIVNVTESIMTTVLIFIYIAFLSTISLVLGGLFIIMMGLVLFLNYRSIKAMLSDVSSAEARLFESLNDTLCGFKEIKVNSRKNDALFEDTKSHANQTKQLKIKSGIRYNRNITAAFALFEGLMGILIFASPIFSHVHGEVILKLVAAVLFIFTNFPTLSKGLPIIMTANVIVENIERLEKCIDAAGISELAKDNDIPKAFHQISLRSLTFKYLNKDNETIFTLGPVDLTIRSGDVIFIVGGNGSGKSTLLKLITGLYYPMADDGCILLNGQEVNHHNYPSYRELFSTIFTDFYLFKKLYGLEFVDETQVKRLIHDMDLTGKTDFVNGMFTNIDLSTGQRKRLAYITALLEDKPIYVFDEWAADQDPEFRRYFYEKFLEDLKSMNKTIIAVTHDDRFFDKADRLIKMEEGRIAESTSVSKRGEFT